MREAQAYFNRDEDVTAIEVYIDDPDRVDEARDGDRGRGAARPLAMTDWRQRNVTFFTALEVERNVMFLILMLIILVAALNIVSGLIMLVKDKGSDIAILRTMGATRGAVMRIFLITGTSIGAVGTLAGVLLGVVVCWKVEEIRQFVSWLTSTQIFSPELYFLSRLPAKMDPARSAASSRCRSSCRSWRRSIHPGGRRASIPSKRCGTNDVSFPSCGSSASSGDTGRARRSSRSFAVPTSISSAASPLR